MINPFLHESKFSGIGDPYKLTDFTDTSERTEHESVSVSRTLTWTIFDLKINHGCKLWKWPVINSANWNFDNFSLSDSKTWRHPSSSPLYLRELGCVGGKMPSFKNERARSGRQLEITFRLSPWKRHGRKNFQGKNLARDLQTFSLWTEPWWVNIETLEKPRV